MVDIRCGGLSLLMVIIYDNDAWIKAIWTIVRFEVWYKRSWLSGQPTFYSTSVPLSIKASFSFLFLSVNWWVALMRGGLA